MIMIHASNQNNLYEDSSVSETCFIWSVRTLVLPKFSNFIRLWWWLRNKRIHPFLIFTCKFLWWLTCMKLRDCRVEFVNWLPSTPTQISHTYREYTPSYPRVNMSRVLSLIYMQRVSGERRVCKQFCVARSAIIKLRGVHVTIKNGWPWRTNSTNFSCF